jgi:hypothetical protein
MADTKTTSRLALGSGTMQEIYLGLLWLGTSMYTEHMTLKGNGDNLTGALGAAAAALPGVVAATLVTSAGIANAASSNRRSAGGRLVVGLIIGLLFGAISAGALRYAYGSDKTITSLALAVGVASVAGGLLAILPNPVLDSALWATSWVFFAGVMFGVLTLAVPGHGPTVTNPAPFDTKILLGVSVLTGLWGAMHSHRWLRNEKLAVGWFFVAGAVPGLLLLAAEGLTRLGGAALVKLVTNADAAVIAPIESTDATRLRHGLIVLVVGGVGAAIAGARTRRAQRLEDEREREQEAREAREAALADD